MRKRKYKKKMSRLERLSKLDRAIKHIRVFSSISEDQKPINPKSVQKLRDLLKSTGEILDMVYGPALDYEETKYDDPDTDSDSLASG